MTLRIRTLSGLGAASDDLIRFLDNIPLVSKAQATTLVRNLERAVEDAAEKRVRASVIPEVESTVKKAVIVSVGASALIGFFVLRRASR